MEQSERPFVFAIFMRTLPYFFMRVAVCLLFGLILIVFLGIMGGIGYLAVGLFEGVALPLFIIGIIAVVGLFGWRLWPNAT